MVDGLKLPTNLFLKKKGGRLNPKEKFSAITNPFLNSLEFPVLIPDSDWGKLTRDSSILGITQGF